MIRASVIFVILALAFSAVSAFEPTKVTLAELEDDFLFQSSGANKNFMKALRNEGVVQVSEIPGFAQTRVETLALGVRCSAESKAAHTSVLGDGTHRRSLGTVPGSGFDHGDVVPESCVEFDRASTQLRNMVEEVTLRFAERIADNLPASVFLETAENDPEGRKTYNNMDDIVRDSQQLEHFHSYNRKNVNSQETVDLHLDQGLFIAFTPALMFHAENGEVLDVEAGKFFVQMSDYSREQLEFADGGNVIVFMLGDGINQIVNPVLAYHGHQELRAAPHAMQMPEEGIASSVDAWRSWYGRMYLPPARAINSDHGKPFGVMRENSIRASLEGDKDGMAIGCSGDLFARELASSSCEANQVYCWHRCQNYTDTASPEYCAAEGLGFNCTDTDSTSSTYGEIWMSWSGHGSKYAPGCTNSTTIITQSPTTVPSAAPTYSPTAPSSAASVSSSIAIVVALLAQFAF
mmetsp:Transcript_5216/g.8819  ORF Transcript_5216/g.8819 Transcript_5216/m.8819 type:complete len:463 (-) Transcript_5216:297-1685(-)|eukprot:CAMPEP_0171495880 /NCGR_PEP_ID=MMETSP0958-20121227/6383_1 /TAXON_ID=87120 /ORGANISM="Aurantiochytrium limacinum, Strain ATCCMYA-1381" /LENGTH=462 /DNA_ID=CAMNT_0012029903 /DNA_START=58 /DNA_END=1446 /DNA_ORIENTATION=+